MKIDPSALSAVALLALALVAQEATAGTGAGGVVLAPTERPYTAQQAGTARKVTFGLCDGPRNADALPTQPVPVQEDTCTAFQAYEATSPGPSTGGSCGGYTVALGPMGGLRTDWKRYYLKAEWGDQPLTQAQCASAHLAAVAWGARCLNADCSNTNWERIGTPQSKAGTWSANQDRCLLSMQFSDGSQHYKTLNIDVIASLGGGAQPARKRVHGSIRAEKGNGKCASTSAQGATPQVQAASQVPTPVQPARKP